MVILLSTKRGTGCKGGREKRALGSCCSVRGGRVRVLCSTMVCLRVRDVPSRFLVPVPGFLDSMMKKELGFFRESFGSFGTAQSDPATGRNSFSVDGAWARTDDRHGTVSTGKGVSQHFAPINAAEGKRKSTPIQRGTKDTCFFVYFWAMHHSG